MDVIKLCKQNGASILTGLGALGVVSTAVMTAQATPKAIKLLAEKEMYKQEEYGEPLTRFEKILAMTPAYIPAALMGMATITCILGANHINQVKQAELMAAYTYLDSTFKEYRNKVKDIYGEEAEKRVVKELEKERYICEKFGDPSETKLFYDEFSNRYFEMSAYEFLKATYEANRMFSVLGDMSLNQLYEFFNLAPTELGETLGWNASKDWECVGYSWINIRWETIESPDGLEAYGVCFDIDPSNDFQSW